MAVPWICHLLKTLLITTVWISSSSSQSLGLSLNANLGIGLRPPEGDNSDGCKKGRGNCLKKKLKFLQQKLYGFGHIRGRFLGSSTPKKGKKKSKRLPELYKPFKEAEYTPQGEYKTGGLKQDHVKNEYDPGSYLHYANSYGPNEHNQGPDFQNQPEWNSSPPSQSGGGVNWQSNPELSKYRPFDTQWGKSQPESASWVHDKPTSSPWNKNKPKSVNWPPQNSPELSGYKPIETHWEKPTPDVANYGQNPNKPKNFNWPPQRHDSHEDPYSHLNEPQGVNHQPVQEGPIWGHSESEKTNFVQDEPHNGNWIQSKSVAESEAKYKLSKTNPKPKPTYIPTGHYGAHRHLLNGYRTINYDTESNPHPHSEEHSHSGQYDFNNAQPHEYIQSPREGYNGYGHDGSEEPRSYELTAGTKQLRIGTKILKSHSSPLIKPSTEIKPSSLHEVKLDDIQLTTTIKPTSKPTLSLKPFPKKNQWTPIHSPLTKVDKTPKISSKFEYKMLDMGTSNIAVIDAKNLSKSKPMPTIIPPEDDEHSEGEIIHANVYSSKDGSLLRSIVFNHNLAKARNETVSKAT